MKIKQETYDLIKKAEKLLSVNPYDTMHDVHHHFAVWSNALKIVVHENLIEQIDIDALFIACWWHDYDRKDEECNALKYAMSQLDLEESFIHKVLTIISEHSHDKNPTRIESKILFDADKIEYTTPMRSYWVDLDFNSGNLDPERALKYVQALNERIESVYEKMSFNHGKKLLGEALEEMVVFKDFLIAASPELYAEMDFEKLENVAKAIKRDLVV